MCVRIDIHTYMRTHVYFSFYLSISQSICISIYLYLSACVCLCMSLSTNVSKYKMLFIHLTVKSPLVNKKERNVNSLRKKTQIDDAVKADTNLPELRYVTEDNIHSFSH